MPTAYAIHTSAVPLLQDPPFVLVLTLLGTAIGYRTLRALGAPLGGITRLERGVLSAAVGLGLLQYLPYALGMAGMLRAQTLWIGLGILAAAFARDAVRVVRAIPAGLQSLRRNPPPWWILGGMILLAAPLLMALVGALAPPSDQDGLYYHLTAPKRWLQQGALNYLPTLPHTNTPMGVQMLYTTAMAVWSDTAAKLIHYVFGLLSLAAIVALGRRLQGQATGFAAAAVWLVGLAAINTLNTLPLFTYAYVDLGITLELVCAALAWILWRRSGDRPWLLCAALCAGFAASFKLTGILAGIVLTGLTLGEMRGRGETLSSSARTAALVLVLSLIPVAPWLIRALLQTGNPVYLQLYTLFPTRDWDPAAGRAFDSYFKDYVWGTTSGSHWTLAQRKLIRLTALLLTAGACSLVVWRWRNRDGRALVALAGIMALAGIWSTGLYLRYLLPLLPLVWAALFAYVGVTLTRSRPAQAVLLGFLLLCTLLEVRTGAKHVVADAKVAAGRTPRAAYLAETFPVMGLWEQVNRTVPADERILLAAGRPGYYIDPYCFVTEAYYQHRIRMDSWEQFLADLQRDRIRYALIPNHAPERPPLGPPYDHARHEAQFVQRLAKEHGTLLHTSDSDSLYELHDLGIQNAGL